MLIKQCFATGLVRTDLEFFVSFKHYYERGIHLVGTSCVIVPVIDGVKQEYDAVIGRTHDSRGGSRLGGRVVALGRALKLYLPGNSTRKLRKALIKKVRYIETHPNPQKETDPMVRTLSPAKFAAETMTR